MADRNMPQHPLLTLLGIGREAFRSVGAAAEGRQAELFQRAGVAVPAGLDLGGVAAGKESVQAQMSHNEGGQR